MPQQPSSVKSSLTPSIKGRPVATGGYRNHYQYGCEALSKTPEIVLLSPKAPASMDYNITNVVKYS